MGREGAYRGDLAYRINQIQNSLGLELTEFDGYPFVKEESEHDQDEWSLRQEENGEMDLAPQTKEEHELLEEERMENNDWNLWTIHIRVHY